MKSVFSQPKTITIQEEFKSSYPIKLNEDIKVVFGWGKNNFFKKEFFNFPWFDTIEDGKLFSKENGFHPSGK